MKSYAQNREDVFILDYFKGHKGTLLSIGENDGTTFSNARLLIENGWYAHLFEPGEVFKQLDLLHWDNHVVRRYNYGLGKLNGILTFWESGAHVPGGNDSGLVSTTDLREMEKWKARGVQFEEKTIDIVAFKDWYASAGYPHLDFISIDCEGMDWEILQEINLSRVNCLCIEWNGNGILLSCFADYCSRFGLYYACKNAENVIFVR